jgi:hypothetical protein
MLSKAKKRYTRQSLRKVAGNIIEDEFKAIKDEYKLLKLFKSIKNE